MTQKPSGHMMNQRPPSYIDDILLQLAEFKDGFRTIFDDMPDEAVNDAQRKLQAKHGTPREFAKALVEAIPTISGDEAHFHMRRYRAEWEAAGR